MKRRNVPWAGVLWIAVYLVIALAPVFLMLAGPRPQGRPYFRDLSVALAFSGMSVIGLQFVLTARIPSLKKPFGSDVVYFFHHQMSSSRARMALSATAVAGRGDRAIRARDEDHVLRPGTASD